MEELSDGAIYALISNKDHERRVKAEERASIISSLREPDEDLIENVAFGIDNAFAGDGPKSRVSNPARREAIAALTAIADYLERK